MGAPLGLGALVKLQGQLHHRNCPEQMIHHEFGQKIRALSKNMKRLLMIALFVLLSLFACASVEPPPKKLIVLPENDKAPSFRPYVINGERYHPLSDSDGFVQFGKSSWYGKEFHGRPTASGEKYDMYKMTAAHKILPIGTYVKVINLANKREIVVRVNDRGPFVKGRIIDLSFAAAKQMGLIGPGVADVKIIALGKEVEKLESPLGVKTVVEITDLNKGEFAVQVGAFKNKENALRLADRLKVVFDYVEVALHDDKNKGTIYRLRVLKSKSLNKASEVVKKLEDMGFEGAFIVSL